MKKYSTHVDEQTFYTAQQKKKKQLHQKFHDNVSASNRYTVYNGFPVFYLILVPVVGTWVIVCTSLANDNCHVLLVIPQCVYTRQFYLVERWAEKTPSHIIEASPWKLFTTKQ